MRFFVQTLLGIALLITGFEVGTRYQARQDLPGQTQRLVEVQKERLALLREDSSRLQTEITVREFLARERITLPRNTVEDIAGNPVNIGQLSRQGPVVLVFLRGFS